MSNFETDGNKAKAEAVKAVRDYVENFKLYVEQGSSLVFIGPKGTGKDHLMVAACRVIIEGWSGKSVVYRDGLTLFAEFRGALNRNTPADEDSGNVLDLAHII